MLDARSFETTETLTQTEGVVRVTFSLTEGPQRQ